MVLLLSFFSRPTLPEFHLDFGYVVYGSFSSQPVILTNAGSFPISFVTSHSALANTGFSVDLGKRVKALPSRESLTFMVNFDPAEVNCPLGRVEAVLPFKVIAAKPKTLANL